jgi:hypothetical protein
MPSALPIMDFDAASQAMSPPMRCADVGKTERTGSQTNNCLLLIFHRDVESFDALPLRTGADRGKFPGRCGYRTGPAGM